MFEKPTEKFLQQISDKKHYLANNEVWPDIGRQNYIENNINKPYTVCKNRLKRLYKANTLDKTSFLKIRKNTFFLFQKINEIEKQHTSELQSLAERIVKNFFKIDSSYVFDIKIEENEFLDSFDDKEKQTDEAFSNYLEIVKRNKNIDKDRISYALSRGGAMSSLKEMYKYSDEIDALDSKLMRYYEKIMAYDMFEIWIDKKNSSFKKFYSIVRQNNITYVYVYAPNFVSVLHQCFLALYNLFLGLRGNMSHISYGNEWNDRAGLIIWDKFIKPINYSFFLKDFLKDVSKLQAEDFEKLFRECLSQTTLYEKIVNQRIETYIQRKKM